MGARSEQQAEVRGGRLFWQASAFLMFPDVYSACTAASVLRDQTAVDAVELFDRASLTCATAFPCPCPQQHLSNAALQPLGLTCRRLLPPWLK